MNHALFRQEALQAKRGSWLGSISLAQLLPLWVLTGFAALAALAIGLFLFFGSYTRRAQVSGHLVPSQGMAMILAPATGIISQMQVTEGSAVQRDQTLAVVRVPLATPEAGDAAQTLDERLARRQHSLQQSHSAQQQLLDAQGSGITAQLATARQELAQLQAKIANRREQAQIAADTL